MKRTHANAFLTAVLMFSALPCLSGAPKTGAQPTATSASKEAPALTVLATAGKLPKLADRLPVKADIMVEKMGSTGAYGDHMSFTFKGKDDQWTYGKMTEEGLFRFTSDGKLEPNVAKGFDVNANSTEYTIYLRQGMKWSDGAPFTSEDVVFFFEHMCKPKTFGKALWDCFYSTNPTTKARTVCTIEKVGDYAFKVKFADPSPNFLEYVAINEKWFFAPKHYYVKILPEFIGAEAAAAKAKELGFSDANAMGKETGYYYWNVVGRPTLRPWIAKNAPDSELFIMERNPYYWKTDSDGRQLPYVNQLQFMRISDESQITLKAMAGETDITTGLDYNQIVALKQNETKGNYKLITWPTVMWANAAGALQFNQTASDPKLRALFQNKDFRQALSIAADRKEMVQLITDGFAEPTQSSPAKGSMGYDPAWAVKWTEYDPAKAKKLLEGCGLVMGADGYYNFADGSDFVLDILTFSEKPTTAKTAELLVGKYFKAIGVKATFAVRDRSLIDEMLLANKVNAILYPVAQMETFNIALRPDTLVPVRNYAAWYGTYGNWYATNGKEGLEPTGDVKKLIDLYRLMLSSTSKAEIEKISLQMLALHKENIWEIGYFSDTPLLISVNNNLVNFSKSEIYCDEFRGIGISHLQNCYFKTDKK
jgi:peptide/nickel transport system substrate-binding protein